MANEGRYRAALPWPVQRPTDDAHYLWYCRGYALASALRLTLPDAMEERWIAVALLHWLGVVLLAVNGSFAGWIACAIATLLPILFLEDQLSQSAYLFFCSAAALAAFVGPRKTHTQSVTRSVRWMTVAVYALAALHKLNRDYFDPTVSCANEGLRVLAERSPGVFSTSIVTSFDSPLWPVVHVVVEIGIVLLLVSRPRVGVALAALMHLPLTIIFAPGFAFTMMSGWLCFFSATELRTLWRSIKQRWLLIVVLGGVPATASRALLFAGRWASDPDWCVKEVLLWLVAAALLIGRNLRGERMRWPRLAGGIVVGAFIANGLTPYLGAQFHHTAAMLSNLRIDEGCRNSFVFPDTLPADPYVRLDAIDFAPHRADEATRQAALSRLWDLGALHGARARWCRVHDEPLPARGTYRGTSFTTDDLCRAWPLPIPHLTGFRRFQVNLNRTCPQRCLH